MSCFGRIKAVKNLSKMRRASIHTTHLAVG